MVLHQKTAKDRLMEELLYKKISDEKKAGYRREGLWIKALSESNNDEYKAESLYVKLRFQSIIDEETVGVEQERMERKVKAEQDKPSIITVVVTSIVVFILTFFLLSILFPVSIRY